MNNVILLMTFPIQDKNLGLEPSILTVVSSLTEFDGRLIYIYDNDTIKYEINEDYNICSYLCSVYISGLEDFKNWAKYRDKEKIIVGGYEPTLNPEEFENYSSRIILGPCDDLSETLLSQSRKIVKGITSFKNIPRYDLYDIKLNQQIIPDKNPEDIVVSINTSMGCYFNCDFCCSPLMSSNKIISKPLQLVEKEVNYFKKYNPKFLFIRDENFPLQKDWKQKLDIIHKNLINTKIYLFSSSTFCTNEDDVQFLKENGVYMICLGLEDITIDYKKNINLDKACKILKKYDIYIYLSFIVDPTKINTEENSREFYKKLTTRFIELKPEMVCGNFLMPFKGTKIWNKYKHLVDIPDDFKFYNSKSAFLEKNLINRKKMEYDMFKVQWDYYTSVLYKVYVRDFEIGDTLYNRFIELKNKFENGN